MPGATIPVFEERCPTCIFRPGNRMDLAPGRFAEVVGANRERGTALICHTTLYGDAVEHVLCHGYFTAYADDTDSVVITRRLAAACGAPDPFVFVPLPPPKIRTDRHPAKPAGEDPN